jgi:hypothetical protein
MGLPPKDPDDDEDDNEEDDEELFIRHEAAFSSNAKS